MGNAPQNSAIHIPAASAQPGGASVDADCAFKIRPTRTGFLLAGCCCLLIGTVSAAEWYGIKVAETAPKKATEVEALVGRSALPVAGGETVQGVWDSFLSALRTGDVHEAYAQLAPASRAEINYRDFCANWHPLSLRYEEVLSPPGFSEFRISGDLAILRLGLRQAPRGTAVAGEEPAPVYGAKGDFMQAVLVREDGRWWVLDGKNINTAVAEASARNVLTRLVRDSAIVRDALQNGGTVTLADLQQRMPRFFEETATKEFLRNYQLEIDALRDCVVRARPQRVGLRGYSLGMGGALTVLPPVSQSMIASQLVQPALLAPPANKGRQNAPVSPAVPIGNVAGHHAATAQSQSNPAFFKAPEGTVLPPPPPSFGDPDTIAGTRASRVVKSITPVVPSAPMNPVAPGSVPVRSLEAEEDFALPEFDETPRQPGESTQLPLLRSVQPDDRRSMAAPVSGVPLAGGVRNLEEYEMPPIAAEATQMPAEIDIPAAEGFSNPPVPVPSLQETQAKTRASFPREEGDQQELNGLLERLINGNEK